MHTEETTTTNQGTLPLPARKNDNPGLPGEMGNPFTLYFHVTEASPMPILTAEGPLHLVRYVNPAFCRLFDKVKQELLGHPVIEYMPELSANGCVALLDRVYRTEQTATLSDQEHTLRPSGVYWSYTAWAILAEADHPAGIAMIIIDTSEAMRTRMQIGAMNEALLISGLRQSELTEHAEDLNDRLQRAVRETYHRVKNNLQVVSALAEIPLDSDSPAAYATALQRLASHVRTLASLHDLLTHQVKTDAEDSQLSTHASLPRLLLLLQDSMGSRHLHHTLVNIVLSLEMSASLSLLISELVSNAIKHGEGDISVTLQQPGSSVLLTVQDVGRGFPLGFDPRLAANTGLELIDGLVRHDLRGTIAFTNPPEGGGCVLVTFPL